MQQVGHCLANWTDGDQLAMPSKMTAIVFALGVIAAAVAMWALADHSLAKAMIFLVAMLSGGSIYFLLKAHE